MSGANIDVVCFVAGAMVLVLGGRAGGSVVRNGVDDNSYPFVDGVRIHAEPPIIDTSDVEERDREPYPFIDGLRKIPRLRNVPEIDPEEAAAGYEYPFRNGLRKYEVESIFDGYGKPGHRNGFPFIDGVYRRRATTEEPKVEDFGKTNEKYPFVNGVRGLPHLAEADEGVKIDDESVHPTDDDVADKFSLFEENHPIKKRSVDANINGSQPGVNATTPVDLNVAKERNKWRVVYGERKEGDIKLFEKAYKKPIVFGVYQLITESEFPEPNQTNNCTINYILVKNGQWVGHLENDVVSIRRGGIGQTFVTVRITSPNFYLYLYRVIIYGSCP